VLGETQSHLRLLEKILSLLLFFDHLSVNRLKLGQVLTVSSVFEVIEMKLKVNAIVSSVLFEEEDTGLVELAIA